MDKYKWLTFGLNITSFQTMLYNNGRPLFVKKSLIDGRANKIKIQILHPSNANKIHIVMFYTPST